MKKIKQSILAIVIGLAMSAGASYASTWLPPTANPTDGNPDAPINVGTSAQNFTGDKTLNMSSSTKILSIYGGLFVNGVATFNNNASVVGNLKTTKLQVTDGAVSGKVLTATDSRGNATWQTATGGGTGLTGSGTLNYLSKWTSSTSLGNSIIYDNGTNVGIGETAPGSKLSVGGGVSFGSSYDTAAAPTNGLIVEGNVGVGVASPSEKLEVSGKTKTETLKVTSGAASDKVLTATDSSGNASWKSRVDYDSGWLPSNPDNKTFDKGDELLVSHPLNSLNTIVYMEGKNKSGEIHQANMGSDSGTGASWRTKTENTITVKRASDDDCSDNTTTPKRCWYQFRLLMWKY